MNAGAIVHSCIVADPQRIGLAPIVLFAYTRADHLKRCVESLRANPEAAASDAAA